MVKNLADIIGAVASLFQFACSLRHYERKIAGDPENSPNEDVAL